MIGKKILKTLFSIPALIAFLLGMMFATMVPSSVVDAQTKNDVCEGVQQFTGAGGGCGQNAGQSEISTTIQNFLNLFSAIIGVVAVFMMLFGGFKYITSAGDAGKIAQAQQTVLYGIVGLVVAALAQILVRFVLGQVAGGGGGGG